MMSNKQRILLIDGDVIIFRAALAAQTVAKFDDTYIQQADMSVALFKFDSKIQQIVETLNADKYVIALSDSSNFRHTILPTYKGNRVGVEGPIIRSALIKEVAYSYPTRIMPGLEGDDVLGIMLTDPGPTFLYSSPDGEERICVTIDKDLKTVPGNHYNVDNPKEGVFKVSKEAADFYHLQQTLTGDSVDGYKGCPGVGDVTALKVLSEPRKCQRDLHKITRGKRKGQQEYRWKTTDTPCPLWDAVVYEYLKQGLTLADALVQARVAKILRHEDYDFEKREPILWLP